MNNENVKISNSSMIIMLINKTGICIIAIALLFLSSFMANAATSTTNDMWAWGHCIDGELGNGTTKGDFNGSQSFPVKSFISDVSSVSSGRGYTLIVKKDGSLWGCGIGLSLGLGSETETIFSTPVKIISSGVVSASAGYNHSLVVKKDGSLWGFGFSDNGQLGIGQKKIGDLGISSLVPVKIIDSDVVSASAGFEYSLVVKKDGSLWGFGSNEYGKLGIGNISFNGFMVSQYVPVKIVASGVISASAGGDHSLIVKSDGSLWGFGNGNNGVFGNGTEFASYTPIKILSYGVSEAISAEGSSIIIKKDGSLWGCGSNSRGQLGDGAPLMNNLDKNPIIPRLFFVPIMASGVKYVATGQLHTLVVKTDGSLWACGSDDYGQVGDGKENSIKEKFIPIFTSGVISAEAGYNSSFIVGNPSNASTVSRAGLLIDPVAWTASKPGETKSMSVACLAKWTASSNQPWLTLSATSGDGNGPITLTAAANTTKDNRTALVTVTGGGMTKTVAVTQLGKAVLTASPATWEVGENGGTQALTVTTTASWTASDDADWLTLSAYKGSAGGVLTLTAAANTSTSKRTAKATFSAADADDAIVIVTQAPKSNMEVSPSTVEIASVAGKQELVITANVAWTVSDNADWLTLSAVSGTGDAKILAAVTANKLGTSRTATISFKSGTLAQTVNLTQAAPDPVAVVLTSATATKDGTATFLASSSINISGAKITERGFCWNTTAMPDLTTSFAASGSGAGAFQVKTTGLTAGKTYYVRAYTKLSEGKVIYSDQKSFLVPTVTVIETNEPTAQTGLVVISGKIVPGAGDVIRECGVRWCLWDGVADSGPVHTQMTGPVKSNTTIKVSVRVYGMQPGKTYRVWVYVKTQDKTYQDNAVKLITIPVQ